MLTIKNLSKYYDKNKISELYVLKNISLALPDTGLVSIFGASGCGKTTLLNMIAGLDTPTSGTIHYNDLPVTDQFRYENVGVIFQDYALLENKTVEENIKIGYLEATDQALEDTLRALDISKLKKRKVSMLSGGEKQRVSIARALIKNPAYIVADEPTGNLDLKNRMRVMQILKSLSKHMLVLFVSHDAELVEKYSDRIITLEDGSIVQDKILSSSEGTIDHKLKQGKNKFNLAVYLNDNFKMKHKTNFIVVLFIIALTMLICFSSSNLTGYKYKSSSITNNYLTLKETLPYDTFSAIIDKGNFLFKVEVENLTIPDHKQFPTAMHNLYLKNSTFKIYPYQNEKILYSKEPDLFSTKQVYITNKLAKRLIKDGRIGIQDHSFNGFISTKDLYIIEVQDLLGAKMAMRNSNFEIVGIVEGNYEGILFMDSYYAFSLANTKTSLPFSIYRKYVPNTEAIERGTVLSYSNSGTVDSNIVGELGYKNNTYTIKEHKEEEFKIDKTTIDFILNDYNYYEETQLSIFYTTQMKDVTSILDSQNISYTLNAQTIYNTIDEGTSLLNIIFLSITITLLLFSTFFILLDTTNYLNEQLSDIIILRNIGISKAKVIYTYSFKILFKIAPSFVFGFGLSILATYHLKSFNYVTFYVFQVNPLTLLISFISGFIILSIVIYLYLIKRFNLTATTLKTKNKI